LEPALSLLGGQHRAVHRRLTWSDPPKDMVIESESNLPSRWEAFLRALIADRELLTDRIRDQIRAQLPAYRLVSDKELEWGFRIELDRTLSTARSGHENLTDADLAGLIPVGEARARQGIAIEDVLLAWRIGVQIVIDRAAEIRPELEISPEEMLRFVQALIASSDRAMAIIASAHRGAELELATREHERRAAVVREALLGKISPVVVRAHAEACGVDIALEYVAVRAEDLPEERRQRERQLGFQAAARPRRGLGAMIDDDLAGFLLRPPAGELPFAVGVGPPRPVERLEESFELATRALATMRAFGMTGVNGLEALGLLPAIVADRAIGDALVRRYLEPLAGSQTEIAASLRALFECDMHIERAAEQLFVHPNTLRYRIGRFEEITGTNLRNSNSAFEVWWALQRDAIHAL
jgi:PucR C-terminal helix-turn-helix domain